MRDLIVGLKNTAGSIALRESLWLWPVIEATHVLAITLFAGTILLVDLRIVGAVLGRIRISEMTARVLPWTVLGFTLLIVTGLLLFYAKPLTYYHNLFFRLKLLVIALGLVNVILFHRSDRPRRKEKAPLPLLVRAIALTSITAWILAIIAGRLVAYDWFDCLKLTPDSALFSLAGCPVGPGR